ncbi:MAG TPA: HIT domain-containing protein [Candidatus Sulfopaludibacter sp.]|nr:HIT domain-containing protein [Candidatus Sulfopaludibacter sp.]
MDYLWTPWRYQYITTSDRPCECVFCSAATNPDDHETFVVHRATYNFVILNRFPYTSGHVMVVPMQHIATLEELSDEALVEMFRLGRECERHLRAEYHPEGLNLGMNIGKSAGAGIAGHLHLHVLPRWTGDTNFMTVIGETRILPEDLELTWQRLRAAWGK